MAASAAAGLIAGPQPPDHVERVGLALLVVGGWEAIGSQTSVCRLGMSKPGGITPTTR